jgi:hypothetical protein
MVSQKSLTGVPKLGDDKVFEGKKFEERVIIRQKMIKNYGTSLPGADEEKALNPTPKEPTTNQNNSGSTFEQRVNKRRIAYDLLKNPNISTTFKKDLETNLDEYL